MSRSARRKIAESLPEAVAVACLEFALGLLADNPQQVGAPLRAPFQGAGGPAVVAGCVTRSTTSAKR